MTFIYWGAFDFGKHHLQEYARANRKSYTKWMKTSAKKYSFTNDKQVKEYYYGNETVRTEEDIDDSRFELRCYDNYIKYIPKPKSDWERQYNKMRKDKFRGKFTDITKCLPSDLIFALYGVNYQNLQHCNSYNDYQKYINDLGLMTDENINFIRNCNNIVPYKENILDSAISKLDKFSDAKTPFKHDIVKAYEVNKKFVWIYLDNMLYNHPQWIERLLQQYDIPYTYFNLDKDNYNEVFGWEIVIDRDITHPNQRWGGLEERYNLVKEIAEDYIKYNMKGDTRL
tara:strand:+ start:168 stop:1019 length:852 start_codon:yes stop_codon:yes gene_type:complete